VAGKLTEVIIMASNQVNLIYNVKGYYVGAKASIEALAGVPEGSIGYATDTDEFGSYPY
jgi:hypothetical protein